MKRKFKRTLGSLEDITRLIHHFVDKHHIDERVSYVLNLVVEELFTNAVKYHPENINDVSISINLNGNKIIIAIIDYNVDHFDIRETAPYDFKKRLEERRIGGLGIPLVKKMMDEIDYEYKDRMSKITLVKYLEKEHVQNTD